MLGRLCNHRATNQLVEVDIHLYLWYVPKCQLIPLFLGWFWSIIILIQNLHYVILQSQSKQYTRKNTAEIIEADTNSPS